MAQTDTNIPYTHPHTHSRTYPHTQKTHTPTPTQVVQTLASLFGSMYSASLGMTLSPDFMYNHTRKIGLFVVMVIMLKTTAATITLR